METIEIKRAILVALYVTVMLKVHPEPRAAYLAALQTLPKF